MNRVSRVIAVGAVLAASASLLAGCGGGSDPVSVATKAIGSAEDVAMQLDANTVGQAIGAEYAATGAFPDLTQQVGSGQLTLGSQTLNLSEGDALNQFTSSATTFCIAIGRTAGATQGAQTAWVYNSAAGGLQAPGVTSC